MKFPRGCTLDGVHVTLLEGERETFHFCSGSLPGSGLGQSGMSKKVGESKSFPGMEVGYGKRPAEWLTGDSHGGTGL